MGPVPWLRRHLLLPVLAAAIVTAAAGTLYAAGQQGLRHEANDPQVPIAREVAGRLATGSTAQQVAAGPPVDIASDPRVHISVFDAAGRPLVSTATLDGRQPEPPPGVLAEARRRGSNEVTWQPRPGVRIAAVVTRWRSGASAGTVLVGRSMEAVERAEDTLLRVIALGWLIALALTLASVLAWVRWKGPHGPSAALVPAEAP
ncbi:MAG: hypothetical protein LC713_08080, partial [Actinobacteria bacterium]|nr:hypothetical protein [Actinomycetota bacterium]